MFCLSFKAVGDTAITIMCRMCVCLEIVSSLIVVTAGHLISSTIALGGGGGGGVLKGGEKGRV